MNGRICGTGSYVPGKVLTNDDLAQTVETNDAWIQERTGIARRHIISGEESTATMSAEASKKALEMSGISPEEIDMIILSTASPNAVVPCVACQVQEMIGAKNAVCYDLNAACSGFVYAYCTAQAFIRGGIYKTILIIGAESLSNLVNWTDRSTCILFGDGAGAAVLQADPEAPFECVLHSDGSRGEALAKATPYTQGLPEEAYNMTMDGKEIFMFAVKRIPEVVRELMEKLPITANDIDTFVLHQANARIVEAAVKKMKLPLEKFPMNMHEYGNTSSASVPILLDELNRAGRFKKGDKLVMVGFGGGLTWGAAYLEW